MRKIFLILTLTVLFPSSIYAQDWSAAERNALHKMIASWLANGETFGVGGGGSGDLTEVQATAPITVTSGIGPVPVVACATCETTTGAQTKVDLHVDDTSAAHAATAISVSSTTLVGVGTNVQSVFEELDDGIADHIADASAAHAASAISFAPSGSLASTNVQDAIQELRDESSAGGGAPTTVNYLVGTADGTLSNEIVVGTSPGGELGGSWASPTVDLTHSGSSHSEIQSNAEATAAAALSIYVLAPANIPKADVLQASTFATSAGATNAYTATPSPAITAYVDGTQYRFQANHANTGPATIAISGLSAVPIVKYIDGGSTPLIGGEICLNQVVDLAYGSGAMQIQSVLCDSLRALSDVAWLGNMDFSGASVTLDLSQLQGVTTGDPMPQYVFSEVIAGTTWSGICDRAGQLVTDTTLARGGLCFLNGGNAIDIGTFSDGYTEHNNGVHSATASGSEAISHRGIDGVIPVEVFNKTATFTNQPANDGIEIGSSSASDTQVCTVYGTLFGGNERVVVSSAITLTGTTFVSSVTTTWNNILGVRCASAAVGTITIREASGNATITTIAPAATTAGHIDLLVTGLVDGGIKTQKASNAVKDKTANFTLFNPTTADTGKIQVQFGSAVTLYKIGCSTDTGTLTINVTKRTATTPNTAGTNALTSDLVCDSDRQESTTFSSAGVATTQVLNLYIAAASGTPTVARIHVFARPDNE